MIILFSYNIIFHCLKQTMQISSEQSMDPSETHSFPFELNFQDIEKELCSFYVPLMKFLYQIPRMKYKKFLASLRKIRGYRNPTFGVHYLPAFDKKYDRCAYVYSYCIIHTVVMYEQFSCLLKNPEMSKSIMAKRKIRVCALGGGPAFEAVAVCMLLGKIFMMSGHEKLPPCQVHITVIDISPEWKTEANVMIKSIQKELCTANLKVDFEFIEADLMKDFSQEVRNAIKKAHIVTMFKFLSAFFGTFKDMEVYQMIHKIIESMSFKSSLFFVDFSGGGVFKKVDKMIEKLYCTSRMYGPCLYNCYKLNFDTVKNFAVGLKQVFHSLNCTCQTTISCSAWIKVRDAPVVHTSVQQILESLQEQKGEYKKPKVKINELL